MAVFVREKLEMFLGIVRKYMQVRGPMSQKELAELTEVGVSTMSRFLSQKTTEINPQLVAKIVAKLDIPLHEIIDFIDEDSSDRFVRLVKFFKSDSEDIDADEGATLGSNLDAEESAPAGGKSVDDELVGALGLAKKKASATVSAGGGKKRTIPFEPDTGHRNSDMSIKEKLESLTPRQKAYMTDFLNLDMEGRDLIVDMSNAFFRYIRIKGMDL